MVFTAPFAFAFDPLVMGLILSLGLVLVGMAATTDVTELFKYTYAQDRMEYFANQEIVAWRLFSRKKAPMGGRGQWILPVQTRNVGVFRGHAQGGALTTSRAQPKTKEMTFALQEFHGIYDVSWKMLQDATKSDWAFEQAGDFLEKSMKRRVFRMLNAELLGYGRGELGILSAADDNATVTMRALPLTDEGMIVDVMDASDDNAKVGDSLTVEAINTRTREVTFSGALSGSAAGDYITAEDSVSSSGGSLHMVGLLAWIDDANPATVVGNIGGIDRSTNGNEFAEGNVFDNSGNGNRPLTEDLMLQALDAVAERGGSEPDFILSNAAILRRYHQDLRGETIASVGQVGVVGGGTGRDESALSRGESSSGTTPYKFSNISWHRDLFFDANRLIMGRREDWMVMHGENALPEPVGNIWDVPLFKRTANATFEIDHYWQAELVCTNINGQVKIEEIAES